MADMGVEKGTYVKETITRFYPDKEEPETISLGNMIQDRENPRDFYEVINEDGQFFEITPLTRRGIATPIRIQKGLEHRYRKIRRNSLGDRLWAKRALAMSEVYKCADPNCGQGYSMPKWTWTQFCGCRENQCPYCGQIHIAQRQKLTSEERPSMTQCGVCKRTWRPTYIHGPEDHEDEPIEIRTLLGIRTGKIPLQANA